MRAAEEGLNLWGVVTGVFGLGAEWHQEMRQAIQRGHQRGHLGSEVPRLCDCGWIPNLSEPSLLHL